MKKKIVVGIIGTIGSGKTTASCFFSKKKWKIINVDLIGHSLLKKTKIKQQILQAFGKKIENQTKNKEISRTKLAAVVFRNKNKLGILNRIMCPYLKKEVARQMKTQKNIIIDCALLAPLDLAKKCDYTIQIQASLKRVSKRLAKRYTKKQQNFVIKQQQTKHRPDFIIFNNGTKKELRKQIQKIITFLYAA